MMERLRGLGINPNVPRFEIISALSGQTTDYLLHFRQSLFDELAAKDLVSEGDELVSRRCSKNKSLPTKLSEDICSSSSRMLRDLASIIRTSTRRHFSQLRISNSNYTKYMRNFNACMNVDIATEQKHTAGQGRMVFNDNDK